VRLLARSYITTSYLSASTKIGYFKQFNMSTVGNGALLPIFLHQLRLATSNSSTIGNGATDAFDIGSACGYNLELSYLFVVFFFLFLYKLSVNTKTLIIP
jgi:hypothetical protein